ncbi:MAG TPA: 50S ribosomal protein L18, partial [Dehalococcoidia bacterium]|nr:50S ribosomal protein L18 [Dehalococcoidia bacterium]
MANATRGKARKRRHARVRRTVSGTLDRPRLNVFRTLSHIYAQVIDDVDGKTVTAASDVEKEISSETEGKNKTESAKVVGRVIAERAKAIGISSVVFDRGGYQYHGRVKALAESAREAGL